MALFGLFRPPDVPRLEAARDLPALAKVARSNHEWIQRRDALLALGRLAPPDLPAILVQALAEDDYWKNREIAAGLLADLSVEEGIAPLTAATADAYIDVRWEAIKSLSRLLAAVRPGPPEEPVVRALARRLDDHAWWVRQAAAQALEGLAAPDHLAEMQLAIRPLHRALQDEVRAVRQAALDVLIRLNAPPTIESLVAALADEAWSVRLSAAEALETLGWAPAREQEIAYWIARGEPGRCVSRGEEAVPALTWLLGEQYPPLAADAVDALVRLGPIAVPALLEGLHHRDWWAREAAARALGRIGAAGAGMPLIEALSDRSYNVRESAIRALGALREPRATAYVAALARRDPHRLVREAAAEVLPLLPEADRGSRFISPRRR